MHSLVSSSRLVAGWGVLVLLSGWAVLGGCAPEERPRTANGSAPDTTTTPVTDDNAIQGTGTIRYVDLEGGFYGIVAEDGAKYDPTPLPDSLQEDGLRIRFRVTEKNVMTTRMWGTPVELVHAERIDDEND